MTLYKSDMPPDRAPFLTRGIILTFISDLREKVD